MLSLKSTMVQMKTKRHQTGRSRLFRIACLGVVVAVVGADVSVADDAPVAAEVVDLRKQARKFTALEEAVRKAQKEVEELTQAHAQQVQSELSVRAQADAEAKWRERTLELEQKIADQNQRLGQLQQHMESVRNERREERESAEKRVAAAEKIAAQQAVEVEGLKRKLLQAETQLQQEVQAVQTAREQADLARRTGDDRLRDPAYVHPGKALREQLGDPNEHSLAWSLNDVGLLLAREQRWDEAADLFRRSLAILETMSDHKVDIARGTVQQHLGDMAKAQGDLAAAQAYYQSSADMFRAELGATHPRYAAALNSLAIVLQDLGLLKEAEKLFKQVVRIYERSTSDHPAVLAVPLYNLSMFMMEQRRMDEAEPLLERAVKLLEADDSADVNRRVATYRALIRYYRAVGKVDQAAQYEGKVMDLMSE